MLIVLEFFVLRLILSGLVNWVCLDLEKNMKNEVLGWRFLGLTFFWVGGLTIFQGWFSHVGLGLMIFSCSRGFGGGQGFLYEILHCSGLDCSWIRVEHEEQILCSYLKNNESNNNNNNNRFKSLFF